MRRTTGRALRRGVSVIEVLVAVTLLAMIATVHTVVTYRFALRNRIAAIGVARSTALSQAVDLFTTMPYANLSSNTGCTTITTLSNYRHTRCVTATTVNGYVTSLQIIITPANTSFRPDTATVNRSAAAITSPFS